MNINYLLIVVIVAFIFGLIKGYRKGFLRLAVSMAGMIAVIVIVSKLCPIVSSYLIENTTVYDSVQSKIITIYSEKNDVGEQSTSEEQNQTIESFGLPDLIAGALITNNTSEIYKKLAATLFEEYISGYLAGIVVKCISFIGLFVVLSVILLIILGTIKIIEKIPVLRTFNRLLGMCAGGTMVVMMTWVFFIAILMFFGNSLGDWLLAQVRGSVLLTFLFNNNHLLKMILKI